MTIQPDSQKVGNIVNSLSTSLQNLSKSKEGGNVSGINIKILESRLTAPDTIISNALNNLIGLGMERNAAVSTINEAIKPVGYEIDRKGKIGIMAPSDQLTR